MLHDAGAVGIIVGGIEAKLMRGLADEDITVSFAEWKSMRRIQDVVFGIASDPLSVMRTDHVCQGSGNCHH